VSIKTDVGSSIAILVEDNLTFVNEKMLMIRSNERDGAKDDDDEEEEEDDDDDDEDDDDDDDDGFGISNQERSDVVDEKKGERKQEGIFQQYEVDAIGRGNADAINTVDDEVRDGGEDSHDEEDYDIVISNHRIGGNINDNDNNNNNNTVIKDEEYVDDDYDDDDYEDD
jgi:hypothetical protein